MYMTLPFRFSPEQVHALDEQLTHPEMAAHVSSDYGLAPEIVGVNWGMADPIRLDHPPLDNYIEAEMLATHYIRPFGGRKILFVWERIEQDMGVASASESLAIPMANGGFSHG